MQDETQTPYTQQQHPDASEGPDYPHAPDERGRRECPLPLLALNSNAGGSLCDVGR